jgi:two-component system, cell cycle response regulator
MRILIAEDETVQRRLLERLLTGWGHDVVVAPDGQQAWSVLRGENCPDLAILDWVMPGMDGLRVCRELRKDAGRKYVYTVLLTAKDSKQDLVEAMEAGADEYLAKPFDAQELKARLIAAKRILDLQEQLVSANHSLQFQATHDPLTGLFNRGAIVGILQKELTRAQRERNSVSVILVDLDHFKKINDTQGHSAGDAVLRQVAERMQSSVRSYDSVGRYGGEEFLIVLPGCSSRMGTERAEQIRLTLGEPSPHSPESRISASMGVASAQSPTEMEELLSTADAALYRAKRNGRNRVESIAETRGVLTDDINYEVTGDRGKSS